MKEILKKLSEYQLEAADKGVSLSIDMDKLMDGGTRVEVYANYANVSDTSRRNYFYSATFEGGLNENDNEAKLSELEYFINTTVKH